MRVMTYNMQVAVSRANNPQRETRLFDLPGIAEVIAGQAPDIVALQEVDRHRERSGYIDQARWLAEKLGYSYAYAPALNLPQADGSQGNYGHALLSRYPITDSQVTYLWHRTELLPGEPHWVTEQRCVLMAKIQTETPITVIGLHLSTTVDQREQQLKQVVELVENALKEPVVIMGDFNAGFPELQSTRLSDLLENVMEPTPVFTCPNGVAARKCIDHIWVSKNWQVAAAWVVSERRGKSDHNPVVADLSLPVNSDL